MACPHRKEDAEIIAEIERRKAAKSTKEVFKEQKPLLNFVWEGSLYNLQLMGVDENKIVSIRRVGGIMWEALVKE